VSLFDQLGVLLQQRGALVSSADLLRVARVPALAGVFGGACKGASMVDRGERGLTPDQPCETGLSQLSRCYTLSSAILSDSAGGVMALKFALARLLEFGCVGRPLLRIRCPLQKGIIIFI
jgi:hypothetical protein